TSPFSCGNVAVSATDSRLNIQKQTITKGRDENNEKNTVLETICRGDRTADPSGLGKADVIMDWNAIMQAIVSTQPPFPQARFAAITQLAVFEAVNAISHRDTRSYAGHTIFDSCVRLRQPSLTTGSFFGGSLAP